MTEHTLVAEGTVTASGQQERCLDGMPCKTGKDLVSSFNARTAEGHVFFATLQSETNVAVKVLRWGPVMPLDELLSKTFAGLSYRFESREFEGSVYTSDPEFASISFN